MHQIINGKLAELKSIVNASIGMHPIDSATAEEMRMKVQILVGELVGIGLDYEEIQEIVFN